MHHLSYVKGDWHAFTSWNLPLLHGVPCIVNWNPLGSRITQSYFLPWLLIFLHVYCQPYPLLPNLTTEMRKAQYRTPVTFKIKNNNHHQWTWSDISRQVNLKSTINSYWPEWSAWLNNSIKERYELCIVWLFIKLHIYYSLKKLLVWSRTKALHQLRRNGHLLFTNKKILVVTLLH